ncbi:hypothetical protein [Natronomonas sp.]|uniref:hypothetical protein n=1 Tax=Natronomonas sp. TaxID=2184060 RepID=UPI00262D1A81|nr:hypothetical protein [Natronomonas sp.]
MVDQISKQQIHERFLDSLEPVVQDHEDTSSVPLEAELTRPLPPKIRVYAYQVTTPPGTGTEGDRLAHLIVPGQSSGERASFDHSGGHFALLVGYDPQIQVFILWDAGLHQNFKYGKRIRVTSETVYEAVGGEIGTQQRHLNTGTETVLTVKHDRLADAIERRSEITTERLVG